MEPVHGSVLASARQALQRGANGAGSHLATITFLGQRADIIGPEAAMLVAGPDDGTPVFYPPPVDDLSGHAHQVTPPGRLLGFRAREAR